MKVISVKQPWASLIVHGVKNIENRTWGIPFNLIGERILIHASGKADLKKWACLNEEQLHSEEFLNSVLYRTNFGELPLGAIVGSVIVREVAVNHKSIWAEKTEGYVPGISPRMHEEITGEKVIRNWVLESPELFEEPIFNVKGQLGLWEYAQK